MNHLLCINKNEVNRNMNERTGLFLNIKKAFKENIFNI